MPKQCFLGIDMGTSGCRAIAIDDTGQELARRSVSLPPPERRGAQVEQNPEHWWRALCQVTAAIMGDLPGRPAGLSVDGTSATLVVADERGKPLGPGLMYNDTRARDEARHIGSLAPRESGAHGAGSSLAKCLWWLGHHPHEQPRYVLHQADWLAARLTGRPGFSDENNALKLGYDPVGRGWPEWMNALDLPRGLLPRVMEPGGMLGRVGSGAARESGLPQGLPVFAGTTDSIAAFIATGAMATGEAVTSLGSTLVIKIISRQPVFSPEYGVYSHRLWDHWLAGGASNSGGAVLGTFFSPERMATLTPQLRPETPTGLDYYPLTAPGERFPVADPMLVPRMDPRPADDGRFFQALLESISAIEALGYRRLLELGAPAPVSIRTVGGGAVNTAWTRIRQRLLPAPLIPADHTEAAYGAALIARRGARTG